MLIFSDLYDSNDLMVTWFMRGDHWFWDDTRSWIMTNRVHKSSGRKWKGSYGMILLLSWPLKLPVARRMDQTREEGCWLNGDLGLTQAACTVWTSVSPTAYLQLQTVFWEVIFGYMFSTWPASHPEVLCPLAFSDQVLVSVRFVVILLYYTQFQALAF